MSAQSHDILADAHVRRRIRERIDESQIVEAAAGTGKTRMLVERMLEVLRSGAGQLSQMVVVTFTEKAAGELKLRVRVAVERLRLSCTDAAQRARLERALEQLEEVHIGTIHGFCADLLREYPVQAGIDPDFAVRGGEDAAGPTLLDTVFRRWFDGMKHDLPAGMRRVLRRQPDWGQGPLDQLRAAAATLVEHRDLGREWAPVAFDLAGGVDELCDVFLRPSAAIARKAEAGGKVRLDRVLPLLVLADELERADARGPRDHEQLEARLWSFDAERLLRGLGGRGRAKAGLRQELHDALRALSQQLERFRQQSGAQLAALLQRELGLCVEAYEQQKRVSGALDFMDLLLQARELLLRHVDVRRQLQRRFSHIFIDEFQDTDPLQAEILLLLCGDDPEELHYEQVRPLPGKLFVVGDPKQSIYRFRRADVRLYERIKRNLVARGDVVHLHLTTSFRAVPEIQQAVNAAFEPRMQGDEHGVQAEYVPLTPYRDPLGQQPAVVALPIPEPYGARGGITKTAIRASEPEAVAAWIAWLLHQSDWCVSQRSGEPQPVAPHHVCLLFRHLKGYDGDLTRPYVEALERRDVPHSVVGGRSFFAREEVDALTTALRVIEWPGDELSVYALLRGPLAGFDDELLWRFRRSGGRYHARRPGEPEEGAEVAAVLDELGALHAGRNHRPLAETVGRVLAQTRCLAGFALRPNGEQAVTNLLRVQELARRFERGETLSFRAFVEYLEAQAEAESANADSPLMEEGSGGVRLMSVHRAKGLEFPVVLLADVTCTMPRSASRATDREQNLFAARLCGCVPQELEQRQQEELRREQGEALRLLYVAATRARDVLVIPALPERPRFDSWLAPLDPVIESRGLVDASLPGVPVAPAPAEPTVWSEGSPGQRAQPPAPGLHYPQTGEHRLVWWDADLLRQQPQERKPLRHWELISADGPFHGESIERFERWTAAREQTVASGCVPACQVLAATALAHDSSVFTPDVVRGSREVEVARVRGFGRAPAAGSALRFGNLVHTTFEQLDLARARSEEGEAVVRATAALCARLLGATAEEVDRATSVVVGALRHPLFERAARAGSLLREAPLLLRLDLPGEPALIVEGIVDLVLIDPDGSALVVDYKTDVQPPSERLDAYRRQVALYRLGLLSTIATESVGGTLLFV